VNASELLEPVASDGSPLVAAVARPELPLVPLSSEPDDEPPLGACVVVVVAAPEGDVVVVVVLLVVVVVVADTGVKLLVTLWPQMGRPSVTSVAVYVKVSAVLSVTVNVAAPSWFVVPETVFTTELPGALPTDGFNDTVFPETGRPLTSMRTTVMVEAVTPSAGTLPSLTAMIESAVAGKMGGAVPKVTATPCPARGRLSVVSVAVYATTSSV
jgi:hypothetical protein